ncbi:MAG: hypothetical protein HRU19_20750 [Pseudobacteriovorax sp.]|nr:hypothetical protein [Pseudobacteriovorax sp.]
MENEFQEYLQKVSKQALKGFTTREFEVRACNAESLTYFQYLATVIIGSSENKILLTVHFWEDDASVLTIDPRKILEKSVKLDIFKEYLNIFSSRIKNAASQAGLDVGISLPFTVPGYQSCFVINPKVYKTTYCWELIRNKSRIGFGCSLVLNDPKLLKRMVEYQDIRSQDNELEIL